MNFYKALNIALLSLVSACSFAIAQPSVESKVIEIDMAFPEGKTDEEIKVRVFENTPTKLILERAGGPRKYKFDILAAPADTTSAPEFIKAMKAPVNIKIQVSHSIDGENWQSVHSGQMLLPSDQAGVFSGTHLSKEASVMLTPRILSYAEHALSSLRIKGNVESAESCQSNVAIIGDDPPSTSGCCVTLYCREGTKLTICSGGCAFCSSGYFTCPACH